MRPRGRVKKLSKRQTEPERRKLLLKRLSGSGKQRRVQPQLELKRLPRLPPSPPILQRPKLVVSQKLGQLLLPKLQQQLQRPWKQNAQPPQRYSLLKKLRPK